MSTTESPQTELPVLDNDFVQDPHVRYAQMRAESPAQRVVTVTGMPVWVITRYAEAKATLTDPRFSKDFQRMRVLMDNHVQQSASRPEFADSIQAHMLNMDPPDHTRLRKLVVKAFTARLEGRIALRQLTERFPRLALAAGNGVTWRPGTLIRDLETLPVRLG